MGAKLVHKLVTNSRAEVAVGLCSAVGLKVIPPNASAQSMALVFRRPRAPVASQRETEIEEAPLVPR
jgi:hypothetical protein